MSLTSFEPTTEHHPLLGSGEPSLTLRVGIRAVGAQGRWTPCQLKTKTEGGEERRGGVASGGSPRSLAGPSRETWRPPLAGGSEHFSRPSQSWGRPRGPRREGAARRVRQTSTTEKRAPNQGPLLSGSRAFHKNGVSEKAADPGSVAAWRGGREGDGRGAHRRGHLCTAADSRCYSAETTQSCRATILRLKNKFNIKK